MAIFKRTKFLAWGHLNFSKKKKGWTETRIKQKSCRITTLPLNCKSPGRSRVVDIKTNLFTDILQPRGNLYRNLRIAQGRRLSSIFHYTTALETIDESYILAKVVSWLAKSTSIFHLSPNWTCASMYIFPSEDMLLSRLWYLLTLTGWSGESLWAENLCHAPGTLTGRIYCLD